MTFATIDLVPITTRLHSNVGVDPKTGHRIVTSGLTLRCYLSNWEECLVNGKHHSGKATLVLTEQESLIYDEPRHFIGDTIASSMTLMGCLGLACYFHPDDDPWIG